MALTWHQQRGVERRLGLHRWMGEDDGVSCLHCGTYTDDDARDLVPMTCSPNDARYLDEHRDDGYVPHHWVAAPFGIECAYCGLMVTTHTAPADVHAVSCDRE